MGTLGGHVWLLLLSLLFFVASSLYLDQRHPNLNADVRNRRATYFDPEARKFDPFGRTQGWGRRSAGKEKRGPVQSYVHCVFKAGRGRQPAYECKHSKDVKIKWTKEDGRLMGAISTNFHYPTRRDAPNKMQSPRCDVGGNCKQLIRGKRNPEDDAADGGDEQTEKTVDAAPEKDEVEESQVPPTMTVEENESDDGDEEDPTEAAKEAEGDDKEQKETTDGPESPEGSQKEGEDPGAEKGKEVTEAKEEEGGEADTGSGDDKGDKGEGKDGEEGEGEDDEGGGKSGGEEKAKGDKGDKDGEDKNNEDDGEDPIKVPIQDEIEKIVTASEMPQIEQMIQKFFSDSGDYLLMFFMKNLKQRLSEGRIAEKLDRKIETLAKSHGNSTDEAMQIMKKKIQKELGKSFQLEIVKQLKELQPGLKL